MDKIIDAVVEERAGGRIECDRDILARLIARRSSNWPVDAPEGTEEDTLTPLSSVRCTHRVGFPRESRISWAWTDAIVLMVFLPPLPSPWKRYCFVTGEDTSINVEWPTLPHVTITVAHLELVDGDVSPLRDICR